jgi:hypothetical protein
MFRIETLYYGCLQYLKAHIPFDFTRKPFSAHYLVINYSFSLLEGRNEK